MGANRPVYAARDASGDQEIGREFDCITLEESKDLLYCQMPEQIHDGTSTGHSFVQIESSIALNKFFA